MLTVLLVSVLLALVQVVAAVPWVVALDPMLLRTLVVWRLRQAPVTAAVIPDDAASARALAARMTVWQVIGILLAGAALGFSIFFVYVTDPEHLIFWGRMYGSVLHLQLIADVLVAVFLVLLAAWPRGSAVALAAFQEGVKQPLYWWLAGAGATLILISPFLPYFTFGEDFKFVKELGYDTIMLTALAFGVLAAGLSISEEIEGRTAITLMSKPVSRRQFLLGKFAGIFLASLSMMALLGWVFTFILWFKPWYDIKAAQGDPPPDPVWLESFRGDLAWVGEFVPNFLVGARAWGDEAAGTAPGLILSSCQVMVLVAITVALATRLPMIINLITALVLFFVGHLTPVLIQVARNWEIHASGGGRQPGFGLTLITFVAQVFNTVLPGLEFFNLGPVIARDVPPDPTAFAVYVAWVVFYALLYATAALLLGLILFEDRDLA